jgi:hypothetical protein
LLFQDNLIVAVSINRLKDNISHSHKFLNMKKVLITFGISIMMTIATFAQNAKNQTVTNTNAPGISFDKTTHDYGTVTKGGDGTCEFKFKNTGVEPLILSNVSSSCGCTVPEWPREPIMKGKSASIKVKYDTNRIGQINKTITVMSNAKESSVQLRIVGNVITPAVGTSMPENILNPGSAPVAK